MFWRWLCFLLCHLQRKTKVPLALRRVMAKVTSLEGFLRALNFDEASFRERVKNFSIKQHSGSPGTLKFSCTVGYNYCFVHSFICFLDPSSTWEGSSKKRTGFLKEKTNDNKERGCFKKIRYMVKKVPWAMIWIKLLSPPFFRWALFGKSCP